MPQRRREEDRRQLATGFNYYPISIEKMFEHAIHIPLKFGHRNLQFLSLIERAVIQEFQACVKMEYLPRKVIYKWVHSYKFPQPSEGIKIYDLQARRYVQAESEVKSSSQFLAEGEEQSFFAFLKILISLLLQHS